MSEIIDTVQRGLTLQDFVSSFNTFVFIIFTVFYAYQFFYIVMVFLRKHRGKPDEDVKLHKYAFLIAARDEAGVIGHLIESILSQDYPKELIKVFVVADNCSDDTAQIARDSGAVVYERSNKELVGKGYALDFGLKNIEHDFGDEHFEGVFIFDADNLLAPDYVSEVNKVFDEGYPVVTSYRNSKNYGTNWITAGYSLWFLRESKYLNNARMLMDTNCAVSGTGFVINTDILREFNGWHYTLLTEDIEFSVDCAIRGKKIGYAGKAEFFDEQPTTFKQSWIQRLRWAKGFYQVFTHYGTTLFRNWVKKFSFACYDLTFTIIPALFLSLACCAVNLAVLIYALTQGPAATELVGKTLSSLLVTIINFYLTIFFVGTLTTITEWNKIKNCSAGKRIWYLFTFPIFMFTYIPIAIAALFKKVNWVHVEHTVTTGINELETEPSTNAETNKPEEICR